MPTCIICCTLFALEQLSSMVFFVSCKLFSSDHEGKIARSFEKWSTIDYFDKKPSLIKSQESSKVEIIKNEFFHLFLDGDSE